MSAVAVGGPQQTSLTPATSLATYLSSVVTRPYKGVGPRARDLTPQAIMPRFPNMPSLNLRRNRSIAIGKSVRLNNALCQVDALIQELKAFKLSSSTLNPQMLLIF